MVKVRYLDSPDRFNKPIEIILLASASSVRAQYSLIRQYCLHVGQPVPLPVPEQKVLKTLRLMNVSNGSNKMQEKAVSV